MSELTIPDRSDLSNPFTKQGACVALSRRGLTATMAYTSDFGNCIVSGERITDAGTEMWSGCGPTWDAAVTALDTNGPAITPSKAEVDAAVDDLGVA